MSDAVPDVPVVRSSDRLATAALTLLTVLPATALGADRERAVGPPLTGKYGCSESVYTGDGDRSEARGFVTLLDKKRYRQNRGNVGRYSYESGTTRFKSGDLDRSSATAIDGKRSRLVITVRFKGGKTAHWACTHTDKN